MIKKLITRPIAVTMSVIAIMVMSLVAMGYLPVSHTADHRTGGGSRHVGA